MPMYATHERYRWSLLRICDLPTCRPEGARPVNTSAFLGTNPADEPITVAFHCRNSNDHGCLPIRANLEYLDVFRFHIVAAVSHSLWQRWFRSPVSLRVDDCVVVDSIVVEHCGVSCRLSAGQLIHNPDSALTTRPSLFSMTILSWRHSMTPGCATPWESARGVDGNGGVNAFCHAD
jgi:hypothetical protein